VGERKTRARRIYRSDVEIERRDHMELMKELLKIFRKSWVAILIVALLQAIMIVGLIKMSPRILGPVIKEFKEAVK
jgi:hypothetical protein